MDDQELIQLWIAELRSTTRRPLIGAARRRYAGECVYCAIGILHELLVRHGVAAPWPDEPVCVETPDEHAIRLLKGHASYFADLNDIARWTFRQIADEAERVLLQGLPRKLSAHHFN